MKTKKVYQVRLHDKDGQKKYICRNLNECKKIVYLHGRKGTTYHADTYNLYTGNLLETYEMLLSETGIVLTRKIFDKWKIMELEAKLKQRNIEFEK